MRNSIRRINRLSLESLEAKLPLDAALGAVAGQQGELAEGESEPVADFSLVDLNPNSATYNQSLSPRDFLGQTSAWYFGHAT